jgi:hypothetical protein
MSWFATFPLGQSVTTTFRLITGWTIERIKRGALAIFRDFTDEERQLIVRSLENYTLTASGAFDHVGIRDYILNDFTVGRLSLKHYPAQVIIAIRDKIDALSDYERIALYSWALAYWYRTSPDGRISLKEHFVDGGENRQLPVLKDDLTEYCADVDAITSLL